MFDNQLHLGPEFTNIRIYKTYMDLDTYLNDVDSTD